jgi:hypothetical protein
MNYPAASCGVSKTARNEASFGEYDPERFKFFIGVEACQKEPVQRRRQIAPRLSVSATATPAGNSGA